MFFVQVPLALAYFLSLPTELIYVSRLKEKVYEKKEIFCTHRFASPVLLT